MLNGIRLSSTHTRLQRQLVKVRKQVTGDQTLNLLLKMHANTSTTNIDDTSPLVLSRVDLDSSDEPLQTPCTSSKSLDCSTNHAAPKSEANATKIFTLATPPYDAVPTSNLNDVPCTHGAPANVIIPENRRNQARNHPKKRGSVSSLLKNSANSPANCQGKQQNKVIRQSNVAGTPCKCPYQATFKLAQENKHSYHERTKNDYTRRTNSSLHHSF